jgi:hypothetical protein
MVAPVTAVTLIVLVAAGESSSPTATAMASAARDVLGTAAIALRETAGVPTDADALAAETSARPDAVAELIWDTPDHSRATLRIRVGRNQWWLERSLTYAPSDPPSERGRTLGLALASIIPEVTQTNPAPSPPPRLPEASREPTPTVAPTPDAPASSVASSWPRVEVGFAATAAGATGVGGSANGIGGGLSVAWYPLRVLSLSIAASERSGSLDVAEASVFSLFASAGVALHPWPATRARPLEAFVRADYLLVRQSATHFDADDPRPVTASHVFSGADAFVDGGWLVSSDVEVVAGVGVEDVMGRTYVDVRNILVATIPPVRLLAELGVRLRF